MAKTYCDHAWDGLPLGERNREEFRCVGSRDRASGAVTSDGRMPCACCGRFADVEDRTRGAVREAVDDVADFVATFDERLAELIRQMVDLDHVRAYFLGVLLERAWAL